MLTDPRVPACVLGDFFKDPLPEADLYILARVLHDWTDMRCSQLLARVHRACKPGGAWGLVRVERHPGQWESWAGGWGPGAGAASL